MKNKNLESFRSNGHMNDSKSGPKGTPLWLPPEVVRGQEYSLEGDVFAFGLLVAEIINRKQNFATERSSMNQYKITALITKDNLRPEWVKNVPGTAQLDFVRDIARKCWTDDKSKRPSFKQICSSIRAVLKSTRVSVIDKFMGSSGSSGLSSGLEMPNVSKSRTSQTFTTFAEDFVVSNTVDLQGKNLTVSLSKDEVAITFKPTGVSNNDTAGTYVYQFQGIEEIDSKGKPVAVCEFTKPKVTDPVTHKDTISSNVIVTCDKTGAVVTFQNMLYDTSDSGNYTDPVFNITETVCVNDR